MPIDPKELALKFNRATPPPAPPRNNTIYRSKQLAEETSPKGATPQPENTLPTWKVFDENLNPDDEKNFNYVVIDPFERLEDLKAEETEDWIDAQNKRTQQFTAGLPAREQCADFLRRAYAGRTCRPFTAKADTNSAMDSGIEIEYDIWDYPDRNLSMGIRDLVQVDDKVIQLRFHGYGSYSIAEYSISSDNERVLFSSMPNNRVRGAFVHQEHLFVSSHHNGTDELKIYTLGSEHRADVPLPACKIKKITIEPSGNLRLRLVTFIRPECDYIYDIKLNHLTPAEESPPAPLDDCIVEQIWVTSKDGGVPMWIIRHPDTVLDGTAALKIQAYGYVIPQLPKYDERVAHWIRAGGIYVLADVRRLAERQDAVDDLATCAWELCRRNYTAPHRTISVGRSAGGWLAMDSVVQKSFPFGFAVPICPPTDLFRRGAANYNHFPGLRNKEEFQESMRLSPLHNVKAGEIYTSILITTGDSDAIVETGHALKMAATLQSASPEILCLLRVRRGSGHIDSLIPTDDLIAEAADVHASIAEVIGPIDQKEYRNSSYYRPPQPTSADYTAIAPP